jgi:hypothetical protein
MKHTKYIYILTSDGHRDSLELSKVSLDLEGLKDILIELEESHYGYNVQRDSISFKENYFGGFVFYKHESEGETYDGTYRFRRIDVADTKEYLPLEFIKWYSGMEEERILKAYQRWESENR